MAVTVPTTPLHGYQVIFSPYSPRKIAFTGAQNYGIAGKHEIREYHYIVDNITFMNVHESWYIPQV